MIKIQILVLILISSSIISCKKEDGCHFDKLPDVLSEVKGSWKWQYTVFEYYLTSNGQFDHYDTLWPNSFGKNFEINFTDNSYLLLKINDSIFDEGYFRVSNSANNSVLISGYKYFKTYMNPCENNSYFFEFYISNDTLLSKSYPIPWVESYFSSYRQYPQPSVFIRE